MKAHLLNSYISRIFKLNPILELIEHLAKSVFLYFSKYFISTFYSKN
ncbi:hypothetical protein QF024_002097 [Chryseobacterium nepalense]|nr:hypothetical protein [Chryseobacterium nepalense]